MAESEQVAKLENPCQFILGGNARFTLRSRTTGNRFTYRVRVKENENRPPVHFVSVLTGSDNESDYAFLGTIFEGNVFRHSHKSRIGADAQSAKVFAWAFPRLADGTAPEELEVWHEGRCGRCGRVLTVPESVASGFGPECIQHVC